MDAHQRELAERHPPDVNVSSRRPLVKATRESGRTHEEQGEGPRLAAENLVVKAIKALKEGDRGRARRYADRAAALPFNEHEGMAPVALAVGMGLFTMVSGAEESSAVEDTRWLDTAVEVIDSADHRGRVEMRSVLDAIPESVDLVPATYRRLDAAVAGLPAEPGIIDVEMDPAVIDEADLAEHVLSILEVLVAFETKLEARGFWADDGRPRDGE